jgi:3'-phosphoadenosine 5'-phosphosulfate sulfotransferase (PAPS reductase)/FAD synthetase
VKAALQFSGGKDSLALLYLLKPQWDGLTVVWCNTGDAFPETVIQMREIAQTVPHFLEVRSDQPAQILRDGPPADVLAAWDTPIGRRIDTTRTVKAQAPFGCCSTNLWVPMHDVIKAHGFDTVYRGQRSEEAKRAPIVDGMVFDGITYRFPLEDWTGARVRAFLAEQGVALPAHYADVDSSLDCMHCTAYLAENKGKFDYMRARHPELYREVRQTIYQLLSAVMAEAVHLKAVL